MPLHWSALHDEVLADLPRSIATCCRLCGEPLPVYCVEDAQPELCEECQEEGDDDASL